jgi:hypothetical protein
MLKKLVLLALTMVVCDGHVWAGGAAAKNKAKALARCKQHCDDKRQKLSRDYIDSEVDRQVAACKRNCQA